MGGEDDVNRDRAGKRGWKRGWVVNSGSRSIVKGCIKVTWSLFTIERNIGERLWYYTSGRVTLP